MRVAARVITLAIWAATASSALAAGNLYGTVHTSDNRSFTGPIRWDDNENYWNDELDGAKQETDEQRDEGFKLNLFGLKIGGGNGSRGYALSVPFGHLRAIERMGPREARLTLKSGATLGMLSSGSDIGSGLRRLRIDDAAEGPVELSWGSLDRVDFAADPGEGLDAQRLYGTVTSRTESYTGFIIWDRDETQLDDLLDGWEGTTERHVPFAEIRRIQRVADGSRVTLANGETPLLGGTNDVAEGHRGVAVRVAGLGTVRFDWSDVDEVAFAPAPPSPTYDRFDGGHPLTGAVHLLDGRVVRGRLVWDRDERWDFETLEGKTDFADYAIPFDEIVTIRPQDGGCEVRLKDDRTIVLHGTNDVDEGFRGLIVAVSDGRTVELSLEGFTLLELD